MTTSTFTAFPDNVTNRSDTATTRSHGLGATARLTLLMRNGKGGRSSVSWRDLPLFGDYCAHPELPGRDADEAVEVIGELVLGRESSAGSELRQGHLPLADQGKFVVPLNYPANLLESTRSAEPA